MNSFPPELVRKPMVYRWFNHKIGGKTEANLINYLSDSKSMFSEATTGGVVKKLFLKISQISKENTCWLQHRCFLVKFVKIFKNIYFVAEEKQVFCRVFIAAIFKWFRECFCSLKKETFEAVAIQFYLKNSCCVHSIIFFFF